MDLDVISLLVGIVITLGLGVLLYTQRERLFALRKSAGETLSTAQGRLTSSTLERYRSLAGELFNGLHVAGHLIELEQIATPPRFYTLPPPFNPLTAEDEAIDFKPMSLVPVVPTHPQVLAAYNPETIAFPNLLAGDADVAVLGAPGSGRTVTLALCGLQALRADDETAPVPVYAHLADLVLPDPDDIPPPPPADPADTLLAAARVKLRGMGGRITAALHEQMSGGGGLILLDGWDEIQPEAVPHVLGWLRALVTHYPENRFVVAAGVQGYAPLLELGLAPAFVLPPAGREARLLIERWQQAWPDIASARRETATPPGKAMMKAALDGYTGLLPLELTLRTWGIFEWDVDADNALSWYDGYVRRITGDDAYRPALEALAHDLQTTLALPLNTVTTRLEAEALGTAVAASDFVFTISRQTGLLTQRPDDHLAFAHPLIQAYLAAAHPERSLDNPLVLPFLAGMADISPLVEKRLTAEQALTYEGLFAVASWLRCAPENAPWRREALRALSTVLLRPKSFGAHRERATAALVASRDPRAAALFIHGLEHAEPLVRRLCAIGLGAIGTEEHIIPLGQALEDENADVQVAAALALGAIGTQTTINYLIQTLLTGNDFARRATAEMLALDTAGEGHEILREGTQEDDHSTRRAAIHGLARIGREQWVIDLLTDLQRDDYWLVRAAAQQSLEQLAGPPRVPERAPLPDELEWVRQRMDVSDVPTEGLVQVAKLLTTGDEVVQLAAVEALGAFGSADGVLPLYDVLQAEHPEIRDAAHKALIGLSRALGHDLPAPG